MLDEMRGGGCGRHGSHGRRVQPGAAGCGCAAEQQFGAGEGRRKLCCAVGGLLSRGLEGDCGGGPGGGKARAAFAVEFAAISECGLVLRRFAADWRGGWECVSAADCDRWSAAADEDLRVD